MARAKNRTATNLLGELVLAGIIGFGLYSYSTTLDTTTRDPVLKRGQDAVLLYYINEANWGPIRCEDGVFEGHDTYYCHPSGNTRRGGLYVIGRQGGGPVVYPINGTGMGQMANVSTIPAVEDGSVAVREWQGPRLDIPAAIDGTL